MISEWFGMDLVFACYLLGAYGLRAAAAYKNVPTNVGLPLVWQVFVGYFVLRIILFAASTIIQYKIQERY